MDILFVCAANIVRSFMAEAVMKAMLAKRRIPDVFVSSAALIDMKGAPADPRAVAALEENGISPGSHASRLLTDAMVSRADVIAVMEKRHKIQLAERCPDADPKIRLLKSFMKGFQDFDADIRDPHGLAPYYYRLCFMEIATALDGMIGALEKIVPEKSGVAEGMAKAEVA